MTAAARETNAYAIRRTGRGTGSALQKGFAVLDAVASAERPVGLPELTELLGLPKQTVHRIARQLEADGFLRREPQRDRYVVGPRMSMLAVNSLNAAFRWAPTHAILEHVVEEIGETCNIGMLLGAEVVYIDRVECDWPLRLQFTAGSRVPLHCTAIGKLLVANLPARSRRRLLSAVPLTSYTDNTLTEPDAFDATCREIRKRGYALNNQEYHLGLIGIAVPIRLEGGTVAAGLAMHGPVPRMTVELALDVAPALRRAADRIAEVMMDTAAD